MKRIRNLAFAALTTLSACIAVTPAFAQDLADGEVRKIDKDGGKLTLKHGEIKNLDMPGMTMVFSVRDKALLDKVKPGDRIQFRAVKEEGKYLVTEIVPKT